MKNFVKISDIRGLDNEGLQNVRGGMTVAPYGVVKIIPPPPYGIVMPPYGITEPYIGVSREQAEPGDLGSLAPYGTIDPETGEIIYD